MENELFLNRELSLLEFHDRVLYQSTLETIPLLERLRFLCISATNLDEFFEVRVGGLKELIDAGRTGVSGPDQLNAEEALERISVRAHTMVDRQYDILNNSLIPLLREHGICILRRDEWTDEHKDYLKRYFETEVLPLLSPVGLDPAHPFPRILNKSLNFIVQLQGKDAFGRNSGRAIVQVPRSLPHILPMPTELSLGKGREYIFMSSIIHFFMEEIFFGMTVQNCYQFRLTRNSDIFLDEEESEDLLRSMEGELVYRQYGDEVRIEIADNCPDELTNFLAERCEINENDLYRVNGPVNLNRLAELFDLEKNPEFYFPRFQQAQQKFIKQKKNIFTILKRQEILLHHPYDSFSTVVEFLRQAARDPDVLAIKQTLYRTGPNSPIVDALVNAAKAGKEVTVVVELRARFDEEANVALAARLQEVGIHVVYGVVGFKTHAKMIMVSRREASTLRHYVHLGTGNYHPKTSAIYTDYGLITGDKALGEDVYRIFLQLTGLGKVSKMDALVHAPFTLHKTMMKKIQNEIDNASEGKEASIILKMNSLYEEELVKKLYEASQAGVQVDLIVRGVCQIRPGIPEVSENIRVRSIVGRFLEHTRVFVFHNGGESEVFCSSADWMIRNMHHRVETCFPVKAKKHKEKILDDLYIYLSDNTHAWELQPDGSYTLTTPEDHEPVSAQMLLMDKWS